MKVEFRSIHIENFMSVGMIDINFDKFTGYNIVVGENRVVEDNAKSNGSGKSSIFEAIVWGLTGDTIRGNKDIVNHNSEGGTEVVVSFMCDGHHYIVSRYKEHSKFKTNLFIHVDGEDKSGKGIRDSEKILQSYLPELTSSLIGSVIVLGQGLPSRFTNNSPSARKEVLETLTNSDFMIEDIKNRIANRKSELQTALRRSEDELLRIGTAMEICISSREKALSELGRMPDIETMKARVAEHQNIIDRHRESVARLSAEYRSLDSQVHAAKSEYDSLDSSKNRELSELKAEHAEKSGAIKAEIASLNSSVSALTKKITEAKSVTDICPTCGQKIPGTFIPDTTADEQERDTLRGRVSELSVQNDRLREEYLVTKWTNVESKYNARLRELTELMIKLSNDRSATLSEQTSCEDGIKNNERMILALQGDIAGHESKKASLEKEAAYQMEEVEKHTAKRGEVLVEKNDVEQRLAVIAKLETIVKRDFRGYLLQDIIVYINQQAKKYSKTVFGTELVDFSLDGNNIAISYNGKSYESLSGGERQKVDIIIQFSIRDVLCAYTGFHTNIIVLDEIFDNLDEVGSHQVIDLISKQLTDISGVFIISHHAKELNLPYDNEISVCKNENGVSYLV